MPFWTPSLADSTWSMFVTWEVFLPHRYGQQVHSSVHYIVILQLDEAVSWALKKLGLEIIADKPAGTYSGGNRRRLSTAIALLGKPPLLLLVSRCPLPHVPAAIPGLARMSPHLVWTQRQGASYGISLGVWLPRGRVFWWPHTAWRSVKPCVDEWA